MSLSCPLNSYRSSSFFSRVTNNNNNNNTTLDSCNGEWSLELSQQRIAYSDEPSELDWRNSAECFLMSISWWVSETVCVHRDIIKQFGRRGHWRRRWAETSHAQWWLHVSSLAGRFKNVTQWPAQRLKTISVRTMDSTARTTSDWTMSTNEYRKVLALTPSNDFEQSTVEVVVNNQDTSLCYNHQCLCGSTA